MTNKIEPVSKAAATFFMTEVAFDTDNSQSSLYPFLLAHNVQLGDVGVDDGSFAAFCRAVADQLDPRDSNVLRRNCFREGYYHGINKHTLEDCKAGIAPDISEDQIAIQLKKHGLLGDKQND